ncbi:ribosomal-protein-alanine N-acetyltransferase [Mycetocola reblochoni]|nr:ribosomal-protein-alanine N-acetyltransferase [Mycetocola reblochoni]
MRIERDSFPRDAWSERAMAADLDSEYTGYLVIAGEDGTVLGYGGVLAPERSGDADIQTIAVADAARGRGWGRLLVSELMALAAGRGARELFLEVREDNPVAQGLYRSLGFEQIAVRPGYYQPEGVDALVMRARLAAPARSGTPVAPLGPPRNEGIGDPDDRDDTSDTDDSTGAA